VGNAWETVHEDGCSWFHGPDSLDWENLPCALHNVLEPHQDGSIWCPECWHTYWDDGDLIGVELAEWASFYEDRPPPTVDSISCCPLCLHDW
jgi:hypothetical protein